MQRSIYIPDLLMARLGEHAVRLFPEECCGILIGRPVEGGVQVARAVEAINAAVSDRRKSYQVDWQTLFCTVRAGRSGPDDIVGFYHSHPDGSERPSDRDRELAWADYSYLILAMMDDRCTARASWRVSRSGGAFQRELVRPERMFASKPDPGRGQEL